MGPGPPGGIERHLEATREATFRWLQYENEGDDAGKEDLLLHLALENAEKPAMPEALLVIRQTRRLGVQYFNGALIDWPYLFRLEIEATLEAEANYNAIQAANLALKLKQAEDALQP